MAVLSVFGVVLGAWYMLFLVQRVFFGPLKEADHAHDGPPVRDMSLREGTALVPLVVFVFWIGLWPEFFLERMRPTLEPLAQPAAQAYYELHRGDEVGKRQLAAETPSDRNQLDTKEMARVD